MPFQDGSFDLISAAAVIEHLSKPHEFLRECRRVLKPGGLLILTCPAPFFDWVATKIGYLKDAGHVARYSLRGLKEICAGHGLETVVARKFMVSPFGFPGALLVEWSLSRMGLDFFMLNQVIGVRSRSGR
jgi:SAM-dependent methyltransferase